MRQLYLWIFIPLTIWSYTGHCFPNSKLEWNFFKYNIFEMKCVPEFEDDLRLFCATFKILCLSRIWSSTVRWFPNSKAGVEFFKTNIFQKEICTRIWGCLRLFYAANKIYSHSRIWRNSDHCYFKSKTNGVFSKPIFPK